jgi:hypothetical protein
VCSDEDVAAALENDLPRAHILVSEMTPMEGYRLAEIHADGPRTSEAFTTDFSFVNLIEHKAEEIIGFYGDREHKGRCQSLAGKRRLNRIFEAMGLCYADRSGPSTSLPADDVAPVVVVVGLEGEEAEYGRQPPDAESRLLRWSPASKDLVAKDASSRSLPMCG